MVLILFKPMAVLGTEEKWVLFPRAESQPESPLGQDTLE